MENTLELRSICLQSQKSIFRADSRHVKCVINLEQLIVHSRALGSNYNPENEKIKLPALKTLLASAKNINAAVSTSFSVYCNAVFERETAFKPLSKFLTRILNALYVSMINKQVEDSDISLVFKIQGYLAISNSSAVEFKTEESKNKIGFEMSSTHRSFDNRLDNFDKLIRLISSVKLYAPVESDLSIDALRLLYDNLKAKHLDAINAELCFNFLRLTRNDILYKPKTGLVDITDDVKLYIKSIYGEKVY
jgi:hypothetical protein